MLSTTATAMSPNLDLGPSSLDQEPTDSSPRRPPSAAVHSPPRGFPARQDDPQQQAGNSSISWIPRHKSSLSYNGGQSDTRPLTEYHSGYGYGHANEQHVAQPVSPTRPTTATSFASYLPASIRARLQSPGRSPQRQPEDDGDEEDGIMGLTGEGRKTRRELAESQTLGATNMSRSQQAVSEGCPSPETTPKGLSVRTSTAGPAPADHAPKSAGATPAPARLSLLNMFNRPPPVVTAEMHDELLSMSVEEALFPTGTPATKDPFSPAAFKNLQTQATGLLTKMQTAYRQKAEALVDLEKDREAERDEVEEAETRAKHLKFQLEDMASKASEQEQRMKQLMEELAVERRARAELERFNPKAMQRLAPSPGGFQSEAGSTISEDLGVDEEEFQKRKWRKSNGTDTSFETDDDNMSFAESESVFSRPRSPSTSTTTTTRGVETGSVMDMAIPTPQSMRGPTLANKRASTASVASIATTNRRSTQQMSTFQKLMKGISGGEGCPNCKGQDASVAWDTVGQLREENKCLKHRVSELEDCLEGALDAVNGIGL